MVNMVCMNISEREQFIGKTNEEILYVNQMMLYQAKNVNGRMR